MEVLCLQLIQEYPRPNPQLLIISMHTSSQRYSPIIILWVLKTLIEYQRYQIPKMTLNPPKLTFILMSDPLTSDKVTK